MHDTRQRILETARELFNTHGLSRVGVRDVARATGLSPGNLGYHFATKDDLVAALVLELHQLNQREIFEVMPEELSLVGLYQAAVGAMRNMLAYRFILLSYADAVGASPQLRALEATMLRKRRKRHDLMLAQLVRGGWVRRSAVARSAILYEQGMMISSGWLNVALVRGLSDEQAVRSFAKLGCALLEPYCTPKGARQMRCVLDGGCDGEQ